MDDERRILRTWGRNRSVRLRGFDYSQHVPYHIVIHAAPRSKPFADPAIAESCASILRQTFDDLGAYLGCFCLMPDHLHVLISPLGSGLTVGQIIGRFKGLTTRVSWNRGWSGRLWQTRFYDHIVRRNEGLRKVAEYIYENPGRKGLPRDYPFRWIDPHL